jgi:hypothetical protein
MGVPFLRHARRKSVNAGPRLLVVGRAEIVRSPDGERWRVRRRWLDHPVPKLRRVLEDRRGELAAEGGIEMLFSDSSVGAGIALAVGLAVVVFVVLPLIGLALELIILVAFVGLGLIGRLLFRRPWMIEAVNLDHPQRSAEFGVQGWSESGRAVAQLSAAIQASGIPTARPRCRSARIHRHA